MIFFLRIIEVDYSHFCQKTVVIADWPKLSVLDADSLEEKHCSNCYFIVGMLWWIHLLSTAKSRPDCGRTTRLWSIVSKRSTQFDVNFLLLRWAFKLKNTEPSDMLIASTILHWFNFRPANITKWIFAFVLGVATSNSVQSVRHNSTSYHWNWWCMVLKIFIRFILCLGDYFYADNKGL